MKTFPIIQVAPAPTAGIVSAPIAVPTMGTPFMTLAVCPQPAKTDIQPFST
jgi:hypothetical protein